MSFFRSIYNSLHDIQWIRDQRSTPGKAWSYFLPFVLLTTMLLVLPMLWKIPGALTTVSRAIESDTSDFTVSMTNGVLSVDGLTQPFVYTVQEDNQPPFKVIIDTSAVATSSIAAYLDPATEAGMLVTSDMVQVYEVETKKTEAQSFVDVPNFSVTKSDLLAKYQEFSSGGLRVVLGMLAIGVYLMYLVGKIFYVLFFSLVFLIMCRLKKTSWRFRELFTVGLYVVTVPTVISLVLHYSGLIIPFLPTLFFVLLFGLVLFAKGEKTEESPTQNG